MGKRGIITLAGAVLLASCAPDPYAGKIKIRYMAWGSPEQMALEEQLCAEFNRRNPDLHVSFLKVPGSAYANKAVVMFASRTAPDVVRIDHYQFPDLVRKGYFYNLKPLADNDPDFHYSDFYPMTMEESRYNGGWYGPNTMFGPELMYYNKTLFKRAGLEDPYVLYKSGEWTWAKMLEDAVALTKKNKDGRVVQFGCTVPKFPMNVPVIWAFGGDYLTPDRKHSLVGSDGTARAYQFLADLRWKYHVAPTPAQAANSAYTFDGGRVAMDFNWSGMTPRYRAVLKDEWDVCPLPRGPVGSATMVKGNQIVVYKGSKHPKAAWRLLKFLTSAYVENELYVKNRRNMPTRIAVANSPEYLDTTKPPFQTRAYLEALADSRTLPINERWAEWTTVFLAAEDDIYSGRHPDIARRLKEAQRQIDAVLADEEGY